MTQDAFDGILKLKEMDRGNLIRYYGVYNENLNFGFIAIRFTHLVYYLICYIFEEKVRLSRIYSIMGVNFKFMNMLKDLYRRFPVLGTSILMIISVYFYVQILMEYEIKINNISSIYESFFHVVVCMTTVGYGDKSALSQVGQTSMVFCVYFGVVFEGLFLIAWQKFTSMDQLEADSFLMINRCLEKQNMQRAVAQRFMILRRQQLIRREQMKLE